MNYTSVCYIKGEVNVLSSWLYKINQHRNGRFGSFFPLILSTAYNKLILTHPAFSLYVLKWECLSIHRSQHWEDCWLALSFLFFKQFE